MLELVIGNKNYSSWSMRPWVLLKHFGIAFTERKLRFSRDPQSPFHTELARISPVGLVPVLVDDGFAVWDTLAIVEYLAERHPEHAIWPRERQARARARSVVAEMHAGFGALRQHLPQNIEARLPEVGARVLAEQPAVQRNLDRVVGLWTDALQTSGGPFLFGEFSAADAFYAPLAGRLITYGIALPPELQAYVDRLWASPGVAAWVADALAEKDFIDFEEPYRQQA
ncbi:glutathione S-transferase family protein [Aquincola tertiaricarbonis]|uniref:Glutathione S-transferase family protein n=1 Tax=Aquincola tertiaricarbonis TaxID=391953 RepID=A0ABY4SCG4_AQUTE|nr:glutathione S-transferase family protein [Aquincola tertiaricarbonis]URI11017.1 glutathione S-transferase family protein [Aquincola tertiaricarbonis]